ncbi:MAG: Flp pilus assembly complex ATPase component TadA [Candidatus Eremiobacteraeota bacterium]|nr:Flp pilus assembly complex ATPase component TadA [Candidatus Eremiobacteraeota bacterium]
MKSVNELFSQMIERRSSHFHLVPGSPIMMKQSGASLSPVDSHVLSPSDTARIANSLLSDKQKRIFEERLEVDFSYSIPGLSRFRINVFRQRGSIAMVVATNPPSPPTVEELGLPESIKNIITKAKSGLIVICGPKSSGKSNTLAAILNFILETRNIQVVTFENPIDFLHKNKRGIICQREKGTDFYTYENAFNSLQHQSCDALVVTEFEEYFVAQKVLNLAAGGNLVLITAQAPGVSVMIDKIITMFPPHLRKQALSLLSVGVNAIIAQTLCNKAAGGGLIPSFEIMTNAPQLRIYIRDDKLIQVHPFMGAHGREYGMSTQEQGLRQMVKKNLITKEEAMSHAVRPEEFKKVMMLPY